MLTLNRLDIVGSIPTHGSASKSRNGATTMTKAQLQERKQLELDEAVAKHAIRVRVALDCGLLTMARVRERAMEMSAGRPYEVRLDILTARLIVKEMES
jgi:hypothetical protein